MKSLKRRRRRWLLLMALLAGAAGLMAWAVTPSFGRLPDGERLERIQRSPNFVDGEFRNLDTTELFTEPAARWKSLRDFFFESKESLSPPHPLPMLETDLKVLDPQRDLVIWLGHSSYYMQLGGQRILIDPVFSAYASPVPFINRAFSGPYPYTAADMPPIDVLLLTHDYWDHVDYPTLTALEDKIASVIAPLGVGAHLERWGFEPGRIHELDWYEHQQIAPQFTVYAVPARHFSGRGLRGNRTLWAGFMLEAPDRRVYISGDSGYGRHFA
ncbi:MAG: MBL fold metallo-hydrolase, partial [Rhodocyclaceae bacterium]|nr:MBL fold metallo-hydrolase [Rhodocyclaceae bacterium]